MNENNKLYFQDNENKISIVDFNFINYYTIEKIEDASLKLTVYMNNNGIRIFMINKLIVNLPHITTSSGIYYEIIKVCTYLIKNKNAEIPKWMNQQSTY